MIEMLAVAQLHAPSLDLILPNLRVPHAFKAISDALTHFGFTKNFEFDDRKFKLVSQ